MFFCSKRFPVQSTTEVSRNFKFSASKNACIFALKSSTNIKQRLSLAVIDDDQEMSPTAEMLLIAERWQCSTLFRCSNQFDLANEKKINSVLSLFSHLLSEKDITLHRCNSSTYISNAKATKRTHHYTL